MSIRVIPPKNKTKIVLVYDILWNGVEFHDMKLAGVLVICVGFSLVLFPPNWADLLEPAIR